MFHSIRQYPTISQRDWRQYGEQLQRVGSASLERDRSEGRQWQDRRGHEAGGAPAEVQGQDGLREHAQSTAAAQAHLLPEEITTVATVAHSK